MGLSDDVSFSTARRGGQVAPVGRVAGLSDVVYQAIGQCELADDVASVGGRATVSGTMSVWMIM